MNPADISKWLELGQTAVVVVAEASLALAGVPEDSGLRKILADAKDILRKSGEGLEAISIFDEGLSERLWDLQDQLATRNRPATSAEVRAVYDDIVTIRERTNAGYAERLKREGKA